MSKLISHKKVDSTYLTQDTFYGYKLKNIEFNAPFLEVSIKYIQSRAKMKPKEIILEVTNFCNLNCKFCHIHGNQSSFSRPKGKMEPKIWKKVLAEISKWDTSVTLVTHGAGEPLLYPHFKELLEEASSYPNITVGFMTNAMLLTKEVSDFLLDIELDWIAFSIDGIDPSTHDSIRKGAELKKIEKNVFYLINKKMLKNKERPQLNFNMVMYPNIKGQKEEYLKKWLPVSNRITFSQFRPIGSKLLWQKDINSIKFIPCPHLFNQAVISWDGSLALCCEDIEVKVSPGSILESSLEDIFTNSDTYKEYRKYHQKGEINRLRLCSKCHIWASSIELEKKRLSIYGQDVQYIRTYSGESFLRV